MNNIEKTYNCINGVNRYLYGKKDLSILEYYYFELTSFAISLIHEYELNNDNSITLSSLYRGIIEILAIISSYNDKFQNIKLYNSYYEYMIYQKYQNKIKKELFHFDNINEININIDEIKKDLPFLDIKYDFEDLIVKNYPELIYYYKLSKNNKLDKESVVLYVLLLTIIYILCKTKYSIKEEYKYSLNYEKSFFINHPLSQKYLTYVNKIGELLTNINDDFSQLGKIIISISTDKIYLFSEAFEIKFLSGIKYILNLYNKITNKNVDVNEFIDIVGYNNEYIKMIYEECYYLNHRNGYLLNSYIDCYQEYSEALSFIDYATIKLLEISNLDNKKLKDLIKEKNKFDFENRYLV